MILPEQLILNCGKVPERQEWLRCLPAMLKELTSRWSLRIDAPFDHANVTCSWVAAVFRADGTPASICVARLRADPRGIVKRLAELAEGGYGATAALDLCPRSIRPEWGNPVWMDIARWLAP
jgi:hypothetical protein